MLKLYTNNYKNKGYIIDDTDVHLEKTYMLDCNHHYIKCKKEDYDNYLEIKDDENYYNFLDYCNYNNLNYISFNTDITESELEDIKENYNYYYNEFDDEITEGDYIDGYGLSCYKYDYSCVSDISLELDSDMSDIKLEENDILDKNSPFGRYNLYSYKYNNETKYMIEWESYGMNIVAYVNFSEVATTESDGNILVDKEFNLAFMSMEEVENFKEYMTK